MNKTLLSLALLTSLSALPLLIAAQCTPDYSYTSPGIYPDTTTNLPEAVATVQYYTVITFVVPHDTVISGFPVPIDSVGVTGIIGMPTGFTYHPNTASGYWRGDSTGCVLIQGMPLQAEVGVHPFSVSVIAKAGGFTAPLVVEGYRITIKDSVYASIPDHNSVEGLFLFPNPATELTTCLIELKNNQGGTLSVINSLGQRVEAIDIHPGIRSVSLTTHSLPSGVYLVSFESGKNYYQRTLIVSH